MKRSLYVRESEIKLYVLYIILLRNTSCDLEKNANIDSQLNELERRLKSI